MKNKEQTGADQWNLENKAQFEELENLRKQAEIHKEGDANREFSKKIRALVDSLNNDIQKEKIKKRKGIERST